MQRLIWCSLSLSRIDSTNILRRCRNLVALGSPIRTHLKSVKDDHRIMPVIRLFKFALAVNLDRQLTLESTGTHNILELLPFFMIAAQGYTAVIDEMDTGIHDLLVMYMLQDIFPDIKGQLIITTHNTLVMTSEFIPANSFYVIQEDEDGTREIKCITDIDGRVHPYHNKQLRYIVHKEYGAVPDKLNLSIKELAGILKSK